MKNFWEMFFKASKKISQSCSSYRKILKRWDRKLDCMIHSDDVIRIQCFDIQTMMPTISSVSIDCDKETWEFRIFVDEYSTNHLELIKEFNK
jgi:hypothetical protein